MAYSMCFIVTTESPSVAAFIAAWLQILLRSAPVHLQMNVMFVLNDAVQMAICYSTVSKLTRTDDISDKRLRTKQLFLVVKIIIITCGVVPVA